MDGLMWADSNPKHDLAHRVQAAATAYHRKHGRWPTICQVRSVDDEIPKTVKNRRGGLVRITTGPMPCHHLLIGENGKGEDHVPGA